MTDIVDSPEAGVQERVEGYLRAFPIRYGFVSELDAYFVLDRHAVAIVAKPLLRT